MEWNAEVKHASTEIQTWTRELRRVLCMAGGDDDGSYAKNSEAQNSAINLSKPFLLTAIASIKLFNNDTSIRIADLGCATGNNTLSIAELLVQSLRKRYEEALERVPEFEVFFSDLPSNDFNSLFRSLASSCDVSDRPYYFSGVPGSFFDRLFPNGKLHVVVSLNALHWLSQVPEEVLDKDSPAWNKGRAWIDGAKEEAVEAYARQSDEDLESFLNCRKAEIVEGGMLFMLMLGRPGSQEPEDQLGDPDSRAKHPFSTYIDQAWEDLLNEGLIDEETRDTFNIPAYMRSTEEVKRAFERNGAFDIQCLEFQRVAEHSEENQQELISDPGSYGRVKANLARSVLKPMVEAHVGPLLSDELFKRFEKRVSQDVAMLHKTCFFGLVAVCAIKK